MIGRLDPKIREERKAACNKAYRLTHKKEAKAHNKIYYTVHRKELTTRHKFYRAAHRNEIKQLNLMNRHKISLAEFNALLEKQGGMCAVCGKPNWNSHGPHVDHSHTTGKIRGILCGSCNSGLGFFGDSIDTFKQAIIYLENENNERAFEGKE